MNEIKDVTNYLFRLMNLVVFLENFYPIIFKSEILHESAIIIFNKLLTNNFFFIIRQIKNKTP